MIYIYEIYLCIYMHIITNPFSGDLKGLQPSYQAFHQNVFVFASRRDFSSQCLPNQRAFRLLVNGDALHEQEVIYTKLSSPLKNDSCVSRLVPLRFCDSLSVDFKQIRRGLLHWHRGNR